jgi:type IV secretory pathway ATPase VirB11/archaellum biosynthesis ATPase
MFNNNKDFEIVRHGVETILKINYLEKNHFPSLEEDGYVLMDTIKRVMSNSSITKLIFNHNKNYEYDFSQIQILREIGEVYDKLSKNKEIFKKENSLSSSKNDLDMKVFFERYTYIQGIIFKDFLQDPLSTYVKIKRKLRDYKFEIKYKQEQTQNEDLNYENSLKSILEIIGSLSIIKKMGDKFEGFKIGDRKYYKIFFKANIKPNFIYTSISKEIPYNSEQLDSYNLEDSQVKIFKVENQVSNLYHLTPSEFDLSEDKYNILNLAKEVISEHTPENNDFIEPEKLREVFFNIAKDLITEISEFKNVKLNEEEIKSLSNMLIKYTVGFGLIETLLEDEKIQDISINSPSNKTPIFITHSDFEECVTNIVLEEDEVEGFASRLRMLSGKPLDAANPLLDTEITTPKAKARVSVIGKPLNPYGLGFSFRRHRDKPWTLPLFIKNKMISYQAAGLLSFIVDGARTFLIAGTRGSGKSSFLTAMLIEIMRKYRIITIEDTLEIPTLDLTNLGYNIQAMQVKSALSSGKEGVSAEQGIRSTLRLGDSCLIVGEVRSTEALALYEAMRVGALANTVGGTIHGDSPYGVYDRLTNDLGVPKTSFKATDLIIVCNPIRSNDGLSRYRRITQITEVRKNWENDPILEDGFCDLFKYKPENDELEISDDFVNGESEIIKSIASNVSEWAGNWDAIWKNIELRANIKKYQVDKSNELKTDKFLEAKPVIDANDMFHNISQKVSDDVGFLDPVKIYEEWIFWYDNYVKDNLEI